MPASLSGLLPVKVSGRHYGENLARLDVLFSSLLHFAPTLLDELLVVARADEATEIGAHLGRWPELPLRLVVEDEHFPAFRRFTRPWQIRPWQRQQLIKLNAPAMTDAAFVLTLDPDVSAAFAAQHNIADASPEALAKDPAVLAAIELGMKEANAKLSRVEQIKKFTVLPLFWEPGGDEITPTMKLKRKPIGDKYAAEIEELYAR